jgi:hypothetical protein
VEIDCEDGPYQDRATRIIGSMLKVVQASKRRGPSSSDSAVGPGGRGGLVAGFPVANGHGEGIVDPVLHDSS